ncbi:hypothetical protein AURDEDRAFT_185740 [Auricularia subglabra TFB-10046 SS5]|nr:hypothetical protein AURDEDRAFT_185740 [Auricularia subglabra TFB-10046 SS5]
MAGVNANTQTTGDYLRKYDTLFLVDDSREAHEIGGAKGATSTGWENVQLALTTLANEALDFDSNGVGLRFGNAQFDRDNLTEVEHFESAIHAVNPGRHSNVIPKLVEVLSKYLKSMLAALAQSSEALDEIKPLNILVLLTGGSLTHSINSKALDKVFPVIRQITYIRPPRPSGRKGELVVDRRIGIQFVLLNENDTLAELLDNLDRKFEGDDDVIDWARWWPTMSKSEMEKILVGAINRDVDERREVHRNAEVFEKKITVTTKALITATSYTSARHRVDLSFTRADGTSASGLLQSGGRGSLTDPQSAQGEGTEAKFEGKGLLVITISRVETSKTGVEAVKLAIKTPEGAAGGHVIHAIAADNDAVSEDVAVKVVLE